MRLDIRRIGAIKDRDEVIGNQTKVKVVKNKVAPPFREVEFDILYGEGISKTGELLDLGVKGGIIEKSGSWYSHDSQRIGQGRENARKFLAANPDIAASIEAQVRKNAGLIAEEMLAGPDVPTARIGRRGSGGLSRLPAPRRHEIYSGRLAKPGARSYMGGMNRRGASAPRLRT